MKVRQHIPQRAKAQERPTHHLASGPGHQQATTLRQPELVHLRLSHPLIDSPKHDELIGIRQWPLVGALVALDDLGHLQ